MFSNNMMKIVCNVIDLNKTFFGTGKRKTSIAKVLLRKGLGKIIINNKSFKNYFPFFLKICNILKIIKLNNNLSCFDIFIVVRGGGYESQYSAICFGVSHAFLNYIYCLYKDLFIEFKKNLRNLGFVARDTRIVERKKFGFRKSRKKKQYSKR